MLEDDLVACVESVLGQALHVVGCPSRGVPKRGRCVLRKEDDRRRRAKATPRGAQWVPSRPERPGGKTWTNVSRTTV